MGGGFDVPLYLGSRSTFTLGQFGGHAGRHLRTGDVLHLAARPNRPRRRAALPPALVPAHAHHWDVGVLYGPHGAPDFFTPDDVTTFFATDWEVHYNSSRTGVRLIGPQARSGRAATAARRACTRRTSTTTPTPSAPSTSPATCR